MLSRPAATMEDLAARLQRLQREAQENTIDSDLADVTLGPVLDDLARLVPGGGRAA